MRLAAQETPESGDVLAELAVDEKRSVLAEVLEFLGVAGLLRLHLGFGRLLYKLLLSSLRLKLCQLVSFFFQYCCLLLGFLVAGPFITETSIQNLQRFKVPPFIVS